MFPSIVTLFSLLTLLSATTALDAWHLDEVAILVNEQLDPIVNPNAQSSHMHKVIGGSAFGASYNYDTYSKAKCSSLRLQADKSNYWMPNMYAKIPSTGKFASIPVNARFYYFLGRNSPSEPVVPFPEGLRILTGNPMAKTKTAEALFTCQTQGDFSEPLAGENFNFNRDCPYGIKTDLFFPPCWDGVNLYKSDGSHMRYPLGSVNANSCPISHPVRLPAIMLEYTWLTSLVVPNVPLNGKLFWANGDSTGYGIHGDFVNGWDTEVLRRALVSPGCAIGTDNAIPIIDCDVFKPYFATPQAMKDCKPDLGVLNEPQGNDDMVFLDNLPGCNPVWGADGAKPGCSSPAPQLDIRGLTGTDGGLIAPTSQQFAFPQQTTPGWSKIMCVANAQSILGGVSYTDNSLTPQSCQASCSKAGYSYAGVGMVGSASNWNCICGTSIDPLAPYTPGQCTSACPGDSSQQCGGNYLFTIFQAGPGTTITLPKTSDGSSILGCYNLPSNPAQGLQGAATYTFTSNSMTQNLCIQACRETGASWAYTKSFDTCACGTNFAFGSGAFVPDQYCPIACNGNSQQKCGDYYKAIVYNIGTSDVSVTPAVKPEGLKGCYNTSPFAATNTFNYQHSSMTPSLCRRTCRSRGFAYAGLSNSQMCYCSSTAPSSSDLVAPAVCNVACAGDSSSTCGSQTTVSIYDTTGAGAQTPSGFPANYVGCSADGNPRTLSGYTFNSNSLTSVQCRDVCNSRGYMVYGTQYSFQCYCGSDLGPRGLLPDSQCSAGCSGNSNERCGQAYILSMYSSAQANTPAPSASPTASPTSAPSTSTSTTTSSSTTPSPSPSLPAVPGCYTSTSTGIVSVLITSTDMSPATCRLWCGVSGFAYSFLTNGNSCGCRNNLLNLTRVADSTCSSPCTGASKSMCGGASAWSVTLSLAKSGICARDTPDRRRLGRRTDALELESGGQVSWEL